MTLVIAAPDKDFLILGADSRGVIDFGSGRTEINIHKKIIKITEHVSIMLYGNSEAGKHLIEKYKSDMNPELQDVRQIADDFCNFCRNEERAIADVPRHPDSWTLFGFLICGIRIEGDKATPLIFTLCNYDGFRLGLCTPFAIKGKIFIAYYLFAKNFNEDMSVNDLSKLVAQSIYDTMQIDGDVGGTIRISIIDAEGTREVPDSDIDDLVETWAVTNLRRIM